MLRFALACNAPAAAYPAFVAHADDADVAVNKPFNMELELKHESGARPDVHVHVLCRARERNEETRVYVGHATFRGAADDDWSRPRAVVYMPVNEQAFWPGTSTRAEIRMDRKVWFTASAAPRAPPPATREDLARVAAFIKTSSLWWDTGLSNRTVATNDGPVRLTTSLYKPITESVFDIHNPKYYSDDAPETGLPAWAYALQLAPRASLPWYEALLRLGAARLGESPASLAAKAEAYLAHRGDHDAPPNLFCLLEAACEAATACGTMVTYRNDISTGPSRKDGEQYSLLQQFGVAGDCEDVAKCVHVAMDGFAALPAGAGSPALRAVSDVLRRYLLGLSLNAARAASFQGAPAKQSRAQFPDGNGLEGLRYNDFISHVAFVAVPRYKLGEQGKTNVRAARDPACPPADWERILPALVLEGTGMKRAFAETRCGSALDVNDVKELNVAPFRTLVDSTQNFYGVFLHFMCARGVEYVDEAGRVAPVHELAFFTQTAAGEVVYGTTFANLYNRMHEHGKESWLLRAPLERVSADEVAGAVAAVRRVLAAHKFVPLADLAAPEEAVRLLEMRVEQLFNETFKEKSNKNPKKLVRNPAHAVPPRGARVGYVRSGALSRETALAVLEQLTGGTVVNWCVEMVSVWVWGVRFWIA